MRTEKQQAIVLRKSGFSYNEIGRKLAVPKGTLSNWFKHLAFSQPVRDQNIQDSKKVWAAAITAFNKKRAQDARERQRIITEEAAREINRFNTQELLLVGTALYWAEGYKRSRWSIVFSNTDESMVKLIMRYFLQVCKIPLSKIRGQVQVHASSQVRSAVQYWSAVSGVPSSQFRKPLFQIPVSSKQRVRRKLLNGTFRIIINDVATVSRIQGWIQGLSKGI